MNARFFNQIPLEDGSLHEPPLQLASFVQRLVAFIVDNFVLALVLFVGFELTNTTAVSQTVVLGIGLAYFTALLGSADGQTIGAKLMKLRVVRSNGARLSYPRAAARCALSWISSALFFVGYLYMLVDPKRQTLHDKLADTLVIRIPIPS